MARTLNDKTTAKERNQSVTGKETSLVTNSKGTNTDTHTRATKTGSYSYGNTTYNYKPTNQGGTTIAKTTSSNPIGKVTEDTIFLADTLGKGNPSGNEGNPQVPTVSDNFTNAKNALDEAFKTGTYKGGYNWKPTESADYFNDYSTYNGLYNQLYKDYGLTAKEAQDIGKYIDELAGSSNAIRSFYDAYGNDYDKNLSYAQNVYLAREQDAQNKAYQAKLYEIAQQEQQARQQAEEANRLAYIQKMLGGKNLSQALSAQGINGGASESALLQLASNYGNQVALNNLGLNNSLVNYGVQRSNALAERDQNIANALASLTGTDTTEKKKAPTMTELSKTGITNYTDFVDAMELAGYTHDVIAETWENYSKYLGSGTTSTKPTLTYDQTKAELESGNFSEGVLNSAKYYNLNSEKYQNDYNSQMESQKNYEKVVNDIEVNNLSRRDIKDYLTRAIKDGNLTSEQAKEIASNYSVILK